jgi:hypothetical protein
MDAEIAKHHVTESSSEQYEMVNVSQMGGTNNDKQDMRMLGRTQVLNVRTS